MPLDIDSLDNVIRCRAWRDSLYSHSQPQVEERTCKKGLVLDLYHSSFCVKITFYSLSPLLRMSFGKSTLWHWIVLSLFFDDQGMRGTDCSRLKNCGMQSLIEMGAGRMAGTPGNGRWEQKGWISKRS